jgi:hypothetical protein
VTYDTEKNFAAFLNMRFGLVYDGMKKSYDLTRQQITNQGTVDAFVYFDKDGNKKFDGTDEPIKDARVTSVQVTRAKQTDETGYAHLFNLPEYEPTDIVLEQSSLSDPYMVPGFDGASVYPAPGRPVRIEFPVHLSGELDGTVYRQTPRGLQPTGGVNVHLVNERGEVMFSTLTAYDGYFVISVIPPGRYLLMVKSDDMQDSGLEQPWPKPITIGYDGKVLAGQNITLLDGTDIPLRFYQLPKWPKPTDAVVPDDIQITMGDYKSTLLAQIMSLRMKTSLRQAGIRPPPLTIGPDVGNKESTGQVVQAALPAHRLEDARAVCRALIAAALPCALKLRATAILDHNVQTLATLDKIEVD